LVLATTVMLGHYVGFYPQHLPYLLLGWASVPAFFIVSGFLITLVLRERYHDRLGLFFSNRALRLFPLYWAALVLFLLVNWLVAAGYLPGAHEHVGTNALRWWQAHQSENGPLATTLLVFSNVAIFGQDLMLFIGKWPAIISKDYFYHFFMYVGPAWTIEVEFIFYAIAPFVVLRSIKWTIGILIASLVARLAAVLLGYTAYDNAYDFPPFEMAFFMAGSLAYRAYAYLRSQQSAWIEAYAFAACATVALLTIFYLTLPFARPIYLVAVSLCLPGIVLMGRRNPLDNFLGELSYPIYLLHPIFAIFIIPGATIWAEVIAITGTLALSVSLLFAIDRPIEAIRRRRVETYGAHKSGIALASAGPSRGLPEYEKAQGIDAGDQGHAAEFDFGLPARRA
jgi:peptidoglycan/LPS O-acetylase OafA/YrhL